ncbi:MAG: ribonuclease P protein component [Gammaproteobacteria bacterium]|nr:ribonuclease P protein component [Gammaproteobacteria bacterium]MBU1656021.1 ribonuclease P protein component [Gammaproteobacteria bacterium]MBU1962229.1 ribonuclease P protein component [Gammaproteobacteria bacterium]
MDELFSRQHRLLTKEDYSYVFEKAHKNKDRYFTLLWRPSAKGSARVGLAISKKHIKRAVDRNLIKRLIRESFRKRRCKLPAIDIVVLAGPLLSKADRDTISASINLRWTSIINDTPITGQASNG